MLTLYLACKWVLSKNLVIIKKKYKMADVVCTRPVVLVTGFGPFEGNNVNASWEGVRRMDKEKLEQELDISLVKTEIPVAYDNVDNCVPALWEKYNPELTIHVGVSNGVECFRLEWQASRHGYQHLDVRNQCPADFTATVEGDSVIPTMLDVDRIFNEFNNCPIENTQAVKSCDAGRYLCEYIYYTSLSVDNSRTLFVHVPDTERYSSEQTARGLERILALCLQQVREGC